MVIDVPSDSKKRVDLMSNAKPDARKYNPDPEYFRALIVQSGLTQKEVADALGIELRSLVNFLSSDPNKARGKYCFQFALEALASS